VCVCMGERERERKRDEAAREVRALLDMMRKNEEGVQFWTAACQELLGQAHRNLARFRCAVVERSGLCGELTVQRAGYGC